MSTYKTKRLLTFELLLEEQGSAISDRYINLSNIIKSINTRSKTFIIMSYDKAYEDLTYDRSNRTHIFTNFFILHSLWYALLFTHYIYAFNK